MHSIGGEQAELLSYYFDTQNLAVPATRQCAHPISGGSQSRLRGRGIDFAEVRGYQPGDDIRLIDWRVTARTGRAHTKVFHEEKERPVFIGVDQSASMQFGSQVTFKTVLAARCAAWLAWASLHQGDRVGGFIFDDNQHHEFRPKARRQSLLPFIAHLAKSCQPRVARHSNPVFLATLQRLKHVVKPGALIILISDFYQFDETILATLAQFSRPCQLRALFIYDPMEKDPPSTDYYQVSDGQQQATWNTTDINGRKLYTSQFVDRLAAVSHSLAQQSIPLIPLATNETDWIKRLTLANQHWSDTVLERLKT